MSGTRTVEAQSAGKNVLFLSSSTQHGDLTATEEWMRAHYRGKITFYDAGMDDPQVEERPYRESLSEPYRESLSETLRIRFARVKLDVVVVNGPTAIHFAIGYRDKIFPGVPIVFWGTQKNLLEEKVLEGQKMPPAVTGVVSPEDFRETIDLALRLQPHTRAIAIVAGETEWDRYYFARLHSELVRYQDRVKEIDLSGPPDYQMLARVIALPPHTVVMFQTYPQYSSRPDFGTWDLLSDTTRRFPTYSAFQSLCIDECIGGVYEDGRKLWMMAADMAVRLLAGARPENIPIAENTGLQVQVDWRALQRWHIPESALPPGSLVLFREPTLWERGRRYFLAGIAIILAETLLVIGLFWQWARTRRAEARRRKAEIELGKSEEKFSKAFRHSPLSVTIVRATDGRYIEVNDIFEANTGWTRDEAVGRTPVEMGIWFDPDHRTAYLRQVVEHGSVKEIEVRFRRKDGQVRAGVGSAELIEINGEQCVLSVIADVTERKQAEEAMANVSSRLIEAQEAERARIARELHDDINQRLAVIALTLESTKQDLPASEIESTRQLEEARAEIGELTEDIQALSHRLYSPRLEYLGLKAAASGFCREMSERQNVKIDFHYGGIPKGLSAQISLCLFRVLQEALHNAVKYSGVDEFDVSFTGISGEIELRVHDSGIGFDPKETIKGHGLGLISMKERLKLVRGELSIDSKPGHGTTVLARVPLDCDREEQPRDLTSTTVGI